MTSSQSSVVEVVLAEEAAFTPVGRSLFMKHPLFHNKLPCASVYKHPLGQIDTEEIACYFRQLRDYYLNFQQLWPVGATQ